MEETSEQRRDRLRAMRQDAMASSPCEQQQQQPPLLPHPLAPPPSSSPISRFEYYTDPLAAFSGSHKKKIRSSPSSPASHASPLWQPNFNNGCDPRSGFGSPQPSPAVHHSYGNASPYSLQANQGNNNWNNDSQTRNYGNSSPSPGCDPRSGFGSPHMYWSGFGSPQPSPAAPHPYNNASLSPHSSVTPPSQVNEGYDNRRSYGSSPGSRGSPWIGGFNRSPGGRGSPGMNRDARGPARSGGRNFQRMSARDHPDLFVKKSMITDPWKDLIPVKLDSSAFMADNYAQPKPWLPKSISTKKQKATDVKLSIASSGPSLAESLAAAFADAVSGENE